MVPTQSKTDSSPFTKSYSFPPFFSLQPNLSTRLNQFRKWSRLIQRYCRHHHIFKLSLASALDTPLFRNAELQKRLSPHDAREIVQWMTTPEGGKRAEWIDSQHGRAPEKGGLFWVFWKRPEEWGDVIADWVEETGQKNTVLTFYELMNGEMTAGQDFHGMDPDLFKRSLNALVERGKAQVFGNEDQQGVKFF